MGRKIEITTKEGQCLASFEPVADDCPRAIFIADPGTSYELSRFAYFRREKERLILETPLGRTRVLLHEGVLPVIEKLARSTTLDTWLEASPWDRSLSLSLLEHLVQAKLVIPSGQEEPSLRSWEFHDLLFHCRSRLGRHDYPVGGNYRFGPDVPPPPARRPVGITPLSQVQWEPPDLAKRMREEASFCKVHEARRSVREYSNAPITTSQLGEFLYRVGRVRKREERDVETRGRTMHLEVASRPYPSGGGLYELEFYVVSQLCSGLESGLYHYDPFRHGLNRLRELDPVTKRLLADAGRGATIDPSTIQVLLIISARFERMAWKYSTLAYSAILKHVGVLYQSMYLTATVMNLAPCALGVGDSDLFSRAAGTDYYAETSVGEFLLGA